MNRYIDWQLIIDLIDNSNDLNILEFGCGLGTTYLLERFKYVYSFETNSRDIDGYWFKYTYEQNKNKNWTGYFSSNFPKIDIDIDLFKKEVLNTVNISFIDVLFVDPGFKNRGQCVIDFASLLHFKYIFTHDTNVDHDLYNWAALENIPPQYKLVGEITDGQGTKLWKLTI